MRRLGYIGLGSLLAACAPHTSTHRFPLRAPLTEDTDRHPVSVKCHPDPSAKEPKRVACAPVPYESSYRWDERDNELFARFQRGLSIDITGEAANANSFDEVADSAWFQNKIGVRAPTSEDVANGACRPEDALDPSTGGKWKIDHGKDNGASLGFRVEVPGKGKYMLKADDPDQPERNTAASVIGAAIYEAAGFETTCEQIVYVKRDQLELTPGLTVQSYAAHYDFDEKALLHVLKSSTSRGDQVRFQASKWLDGYVLGPFRFEGTRDDDPNDVVPHERRRELRGSRLIAAWLNHWDSKEQNSMDVWVAQDEKKPRSSPGYVQHYILDTSDSLGQYMRPGEIRAGHSYRLDLGDLFRDFFTFGIIERPWDRSHKVTHHERWGYYTADNFDPEDWKGAYPNPAFLRMTERDAAWMARIIARFTPAQLRAMVVAANLTEPAETDYLTQVLIARQRTILARYLTRLSPLGNVHVETDGRICATDFARASAIVPADRFHYAATGPHHAPLAVTVGDDGGVCIAPHSFVGESSAPDADPSRYVTIRVTSGVGGPLDIHAYDLGARGLRVVGLTRPE